MARGMLDLAVQPWETLQVAQKHNSQSSSTPQICRASQTESDSLTLRGLSSWAPLNAQQGQRKGLAAGEEKQAGAHDS
jgi:hypothetical protein